MLQGARPALVSRAIERRDPLPGTRGFAGSLPDGRLVRDVLGRVPCFVDRTDRDAWAFSPTELADPVSVPAGSVRSGATDRQVWSLPSPPPYESAAEGIDEIAAATRASLADVPVDGTAVAFSGGVDSAVLASALDVPLYVAGFPGGHDLESARSAASVLDRELVVVELTHEALTRAIPTVATATNRTNAMDVAIGLPLFLVAERAASDGHDRLVLGQGADELFGGYEKVAQVDHRVAATTVRGAVREVIGTLPDGLERDVLATRAAGIEPIAPLLDDRLVRVALSLGDDLLVRDGVRKWAFREAAREFVPDAVAEREKKALQYGSLTARELDRLARRAGFKRRMDDHVSAYVRSLVASNRGQ